MAALGVDGQVQPRSEFPKLEEGNHLRWGFDPAIGFARYGYYLFRREHVGPGVKPIRLSDELQGQLSQGQLSLPRSISTTDGPILLDGSGPVDATDDFKLTGGTSFSSGADGIAEIGFDGLLRFKFPAPLFDVTVVVDVTDEVYVEAYATDGEGDRVVVDDARLTTAGAVSLNFDAIDGVRLTGVGTVVDVRYKFVGDQYHLGWDPVPNTKQPFTLPLRHPEYPATGGGAQNVSWARSVTATRIRYGDPAEYVTPGPTTQNGQAAVANDSSIVTTPGTWTAGISGATIRIGSDTTTYVVADRLTDTRITLERPYEGTSRTTSYEISEDDFAHLHASLVSLVDEWPSGGGMAGRVTPRAIDTGSALYWAGEATVIGSGTSWTSDLEGLQFVPAVTSRGTVSVDQGESAVQRDPGSVLNPSWDEQVVDCTVRIDGQLAEYTIVGVDGARLLLDRPYAGPDVSNVPFAIFGETSYEIATVIDPNELVLKTPYRGPTSSSDYVIRTAFGTTENGPRFPRQHPLDSVLLATLSPTFAQALGLYWTDDTAEPDQSYDYLVVADHSGRVARYYEEGGSFDPRNAELFGPWGGTGDADGYIVFDVQRSRSEPLARPEGVAAYELPQRPPTDQPTARNAAGLGWGHVASETGRTVPGGPVYYHLWRHDYDDDPSTDPETIDEYTLLTSTPGRPTGRDPVMVGASDREPPAGWPAEPIHAVDAGLDDGWYGYRVNGIDVFGRASELSEPGSWLELDGTTVQHPVAIKLRDDTPPPPPRAVLAEHAPATTVPDEGNGEMTVRWLWPTTFARQAPDTTKFHIHYHPGNFSDQQGTTTTVTKDATGVYTVETDIEPVDPPDGLGLGAGYAGAMLHVGGTAYEVTDSHERGGRLVLTIGDRRASPPTELPTVEGFTPVVETDSRPHVVGSPETSFDLHAPASDTACTVAVPPFYQRGSITVGDGSTDVYGTDTGWTSALEGQSFTTAEGGLYEVVSVQSPTHLTLDRPYDIGRPGATVREGIGYGIDHPISKSPMEASNWSRPSEPADWESWATVPVTAGTTVDPTTIPSEDRQFPAEREPYEIYEVTVPVPAAPIPTTDPFVPTADRPVVYANVGVSAIDVDQNESAVSGPVTIARAKTDPPAPPESPSYDDEIDWATAPDFDGRAHYTVRWRHPEELCRAHVYRVLDKSLYELDWQRRRDGASQDVTTSETDKALFPVARRDDDVRRGQIVDELDALHATVVTETTFGGVLEAYATLSSDAKQVLAGLPANRPAYQQVTMSALAPTDGAARNRGGPDLRPDEQYPTGPRWCAYVDSFEGRSRRQYFYRTGTVDAAGNRSEEWSYPTLPVQAVDTTPPAAPSVTSIEAGHHDDTESDDRAITLRWRAGTESDLVEYHIFRTDQPNASRDRRLMDLVATVVQPETPEVVWSDTGRPDGLTHYYRIVAVDDDENRSLPSRTLSGRAIDTGPPLEPTIDRIEWVRLDDAGEPVEWAEGDSSDPPAVLVEWSTSASLSDSIDVSLQSRGPTDVLWLSLGKWQSPTRLLLHDSSPETDADRSYRVVLRNARNERSASAGVTIPAPGN